MDAEQKQGALSDGIALYNEGKANEALDFFLSIASDVSDAGTAAELNYYIGLCCAALCRYDDAMVYLEQVVTGAQGAETDAAERILQCRLILAVIYTLTGRHSLAEFEMQKLLDAGYKEDSVYCAAAFMSWEEQDADKSISYYERALECNENCVTALNGLGYVLSEEGRDLTRALDCCVRAVEMSRTAATLDSLGCVYLKLGMNDKGRQCLEEALSLSSGGQRNMIKKHLERE